MNDLRAALGRRAEAFDVDADAYGRVLATVHRRRRRRRFVAVAMPGATGSADSVSWDLGGNGLFAQIGGRWVRVSDLGGSAPPQIHDLGVPSLPVGPSILSVSPDGTLVLLFGLTNRADGSAEPHL